jgi:methylmalonic aciduria homocystinuria type C protein
VRWAHDVPPRRVAMQRLTHLSGLAFLSVTNLTVHPVYGPWFALRAAAVVDVDGPPAPAEPSDPCTGCEMRCVPAFRRALAAVQGAPTQARIATRWPLWLAVRDACAVGKEHRYADDQIRYHYAKDRRVLALLAMS